MDYVDIYGLLLSNSHPSLNMGFVSLNQDGFQNGPKLVVCTCGHYNFNHLSPGFQISYLLVLSYTGQTSNMGFV